MLRAPEKDLCPGGPATDGCPVGSLRRRAPVQGTAGIGARPFDSADRRFNLKLTWFVGIDWGSQKHQACVLDAAGKVLGEREFEHGGAGLSQMADWLLSFGAADESEVGRCGRNAERSRGRESDGAGFRRPLDQPEAARPFPGPHVASGREGRPARRPGARLGAAHRPALSATAGADRPGDHRVAGVVPSRRGLDAGTRSPGESHAAAALALLPAVPRRG